MIEDRDYNVTLSWHGVKAFDAQHAALRFQFLMHARFPAGTVVYVTDNETGNETAVEL